MEVGNGKLNQRLGDSHRMGNRAAGHVFYATKQWWNTIKVIIELFQFHTICRNSNINLSSHQFFHKIYWCVSLFLVALSCKYLWTRSASLPEKIVDQISTCSITLPVIPTISESFGKLSWINSRPVTMMSGAYFNLPFAFALEGGDFWHQANRNR